MKRLYFIPALLFSFIIASSQENTESQLLNAMHSISSHDLLDYVKKQCEERYQGRLTGTKEYLDCAEWLAGELASWGISPACAEGSWFQWFNVPYTLVFPGCELSVNIPLKNGGNILKHYRYISEFMPGSTSGNGATDAEVIYAGFGITAPELGYDDYSEIDVTGKIVLIEREAPVDPSEGAEKFNQWFKHSFHQAKLENAVRHGAAGMIYNYGPIANPNNAYNKDFIYVHAGDSVVNDLFSGTGINHSEILEKIRRELEPHSFNTGKSASIKMNTQHFPKGRGCNVIGIIKGSDPVLCGETIILGAHLDHLGRCWEMIPGANDNASAVAVMMGVAKALATNGIKLKRSVMFIAFGSEEQSLLGSKEYIKNPVMPLETSVLLNMDGVGIGNSISSTAGKNFPLLFSSFEEANSKYIHRPLSAGYFSNLGRPRLDAAIFMKAGVPSLSFSTYGSTNYYHVPLDNIDIIKPEIMEDMARLLFIAVTEMANRETEIR